LKSDSVQQKSGQDLLDINFEQPALWNTDKELRIGNLFKNFSSSIIIIFIGEQTQKLMLLLNFDEKKSFYQDARNIYQTIANYFKKNLPLNNILLRDLQVLGFLSRPDRSSSDQII